MGQQSESQPKGREVGGASCANEWMGAKGEASQAIALETSGDGIGKSNSSFGQLTLRAASQPRGFVASSSR